MGLMPIQVRFSCWRIGSDGVVDLVTRLRDRGVKVTEIPKWGLIYNIAGSSQLLVT